MSQAPRLGRAGVLAGLLSVVALSCSSDIVELLPPTGGASGSGGNGSAAGQDAVDSGASTGGSNAAGATTQGGSAGATQAGGGNGGNGGTAGAPCFGFGCGGENGFGGSFGSPYCRNGNSCAPCANGECPFDEECSPLGNVCVQCAIKGPSQCWAGSNCDVLVGRCAPACDSTSDCSDGRVCDQNQGTCLGCIDDKSQCDQDGDPQTRICYLHRCVECTQDPDCTKQMGGGRCANFRCVQCLTDKDCDDGRRHCDVPKGFCE
jgi:hypothetical protein